jgi:hypothetical protein
MEIVERIPLVNEDKVWAGDRDIKLTLNTDTGRVSIDTPAMFSDPVATLDDLQEAVKNLVNIHQSQEPPAPRDPTKPST